MSLRRSKVPKLIPLISLIILLTLIPLAISFLQTPGGVEAAWVDDNFSYRNAIPITSHTAAENNVYITATIDTSASGQFQSDCGDLRFTTVGGDILPYYIVSGCVSASTVVHVFFKSMPAGAQTLYYYYGNPSAANGFSSADFATVATNYAVGTVASQEKGGAPIAYWKFDDGTGTNAQDSSSNGKNGTISGATWKPESECLSGKCLYFDGNDTVTNSSFGFIPTTGTISLWQKTPFAWADASGGDLWLAQIRNSDTTSFIAFQNYTPGDSLQFKYYYSSTYQTNQGITPAFSAASWHHITMTFEANSVKLYVDGVLRSTDTSATMLGSALDYLVAGYQYTGYIDELKVYNYVQSLAQIKSDFKSRGTAKGTSVSLSSRAGVEGSLSNGLVGYWKMDEVSGAGSTLADSSGNSNTGTAVLWGGGNTSTDSAHVAGKFGNSFSFDGGDDAITIPDATSLRFTSTTGVSVSAWVKMNATNQNDDIVSKMSGNNGIQLRRNSSGKFTWAIGNGTTTATSTNTTSLSTGTWYHVTGTFDRNTLYVYVNGVQEGSNTISGFSDDTAQLVIGNENQLSNNAYWDGTIDEVRIYNRALSPREVRDLYAFAPGPVGYWNFEEKSGTNAYDTSGNSQTGTINGNPTWISSKYTGSGLNFDGTGDYVSYTLPSTSPLKISGALTLSYWMNTTTGTSDAGLVGTGITTGYQCTHHNGATLYCYISSGGNGITATLGTGTWKYISFTWDGTTGTNGMKLYIDGVLTSQRTSTVAVASGWTTLQIGKSSTDYNGKLDDVKIYNYVRTQKQIVEDMNAGHPVGGSPVGSQIAYYKFDEGYGTTTNNSGSGGTSTNGTITGATWINAGKFGKALDFETSDATDKVVATITDSGLATAMTLSQWVNAETFVDAGGVNGNFSNGGIKLFSNSNGTYTAGFRNNPGSYTTCTTTTVTSAGTWYYLSVTYDTGTLKMYINGKLDKTCTGDTALKNNSGFYIGYNADQNYYYDGLIDEVKIYNSALTEDEIKLDYNRGQAMVLGTTGDASSSAGAIYCQPGSSDTCNPPVGEWNFNENGGVTTQDTSGNGNTGTITGATWNAIGKTGSALDFDGNDDNVNAGSGSSLQLTSTGTVTLWFKANAAFSGAQAAQKHLMSGGPRDFYFSSSSSKLFYFLSDDTTYAVSDSGSWDTNWHFVAATSDGTTVKMYIDGVVQSATGSATGKNFFGNTGALTIGRSSASFPGKIDQVRVFNYARTAAQIALDYNQGKPIGHWKMDECQGAAAFDAGGSGNTGTITIGATGTQTAVGTCTTSGTAWYNGVTGKFNSSLNFDGTDDYVDVTTESNFDFTDAITISAWIKEPTGSSSRSIVAKSGYGSDSFRFMHNWDNTFTFEVNSQDLATTNTYTGTSWRHVVASYDKQNMKIYVNGILDGSVSYSTAISTNNNNLRFGITPVSNTYLFSGQIDDVRIYNYALTATQVKNLFNGGAAVKFAPLTGSP